MTRTLSLFILASIVLAGCATPSVMPAPATKAGLDRAIDMKAEYAFSHVERPLDEGNTIIYHQAFGGSVAVGALFGPIGVAANIAMISSRTSDDVQKLSGKYAFDVAKTFEQSLRNRLPLAPVVTKGQSVVLTPRLLMVKTENDDILLGCLLMSDEKDVGGLAWPRRYVHQTDLSVPFEEFSTGLSDARKADMDKGMTSCLDSTAQMYADDSAGKLMPAEEDNAITFRSEFLTPRIAFDLWGKQAAATDERVIVRSTNGLFSFPQSKVKITRN